MKAYRLFLGVYILALGGYLLNNGQGIGIILFAVGIFVIGEVLS
jgi:hypothetical protein